MDDAFWALLAWTFVVASVTFCVTESDLNEKWENRLLKEKHGEYIINDKQDKEFKLFPMKEDK